MPEQTGDINQNKMTKGVTVSHLLEGASCASQSSLSFSSRWASRLVELLTQAGARRTSPTMKGTSCESFSSRVASRQLWLLRQQEQHKMSKHSRVAVEQQDSILRLRISSPIPDQHRIKLEQHISRSTTDPHLDAMNAAVVGDLLDRGK
jgi:hypothetical protein